MGRILGSLPPPGRPVASRHATHRPHLSSILRVSGLRPRATRGTRWRRGVERESERSEPGLRPSPFISLRRS